MRFCIAALMFLCISTAAAAAGAELPLQAGDRVRVKAFGTEGVFVVDELLPDALVLRDPDGIMPQKIRIEDISSLAIGVPNSPARGAAQGAAIVALIGLLSGFVAGFAVGNDPGYDDDSNSDGDLYLSAEGKAWVYGGTLCAAGAFIGAVVGAGYPGERWESIPLDARIDARAVRNGTVRIGVAFSLGGS